MIHRRRAARHNSKGWSLRHAQASTVVRVPSVLSDREIDALHELRREGPYKGATLHTFPRHETCYLSFDNAFGAALPGVRQKLLDVATRVDAEQRWQLLRGRVTPRVVELHTATRRTPSVTRCSSWSITTVGRSVDVMLSPADAFEGCEFETLESSGELLSHRFERGDALVFVSHKYHTVSGIQSGTRQVLVMEVWSGEERYCPHRCCTRDGRCRDQVDSSKTRTVAGVPVWVDRM
jgi:hypothetical protein